MAPRRSSRSSGRQSTTQRTVTRREEEGGEEECESRDVIDVAGGDVAILAAQIEDAFAKYKTGALMRGRDSPQ